MNQKIHFRPPCSESWMKLCPGCRFRPWALIQLKENPLDWVSWSGGGGGCLGKIGRGKGVVTGLNDSICSLPASAFYSARSIDKGRIYSQTFAERLNRNNYVEPLCPILQTSQPTCLKPWSLPNTELSSPSLVVSNFCLVRSWWLQNVLSWFLICWMIYHRSITR